MTPSDPGTVDVPRCINATGLHDFMPAVVVRAVSLLSRRKVEQAVTFCRVCGEASMAGWQ